MSAAGKFAVGFGVARLHHIFSAARRERLVREVLDIGCSHLDVAPLYGDGLAEVELGRILGERRKQVTIATKFGIPCSDLGARHPAANYVRRGIGRVLGSSAPMSRDFSASEMKNSLGASLRRLRTDWVDYLFVHEPLNAGDPGEAAELVEALEAEKRAGRIRHYGIAAPTGLLLDMKAKGCIWGDALQFGLSASSQDLVREAGPRASLFAYGLYGFRRSGTGAGQLEIADELRWFRGNFPGAVPILSTGREDEVRRIGRAAAALA